MRDRDVTEMIHEVLWFLNEFGDEILDLGDHWNLTPREAMNWIITKGRVDMILATKTRRSNERHP